MELIDEVPIAVKSAIPNWGKLLIVTGGNLKLEKCLYHLIDFVWTRKRGWQYITHHEGEGAALFLLLPDGTMAAISHLAINDSEKILGVVMCPCGNSTGRFHQMKEKAMKWFNSLTAGRLHQYGLCCSMATLPELHLVLLPL